MCLFIRWTINTKYYTADVAVWMSHLCDGFSTVNMTISDQLAALVMVFDMTDVRFFSLHLFWILKFHGCLDAHPGIIYDV